MKEECHVGVVTVIWRNVSFHLQDIHVRLVCVEEERLHGLLMRHTSPQRVEFIGFRRAQTPYAKYTTAKDEAMVLCGVFASFVC